MATLAARGETPAAFARRCIPAAGVAPPSNIADILGRRALPAGRLATLGATPAFHHGLLVDSNVLLDVLTEDAEWLDWSSASLAACAENGRLIINPLVYAEVSIRFSAIEDLDDALPAEYFVREALPWDAAFLAGKAFMHYRRRGGARSHPLADFYIGAHAAIAGYTLLTRDARRYRTYYPKLRLIAP
jgi:predicted nucleic acid-binding protein